MIRPLDNYGVHWTAVPMLPLMNVVQKCTCKDTDKHHLLSDPEYSSLQKVNIHTC